MLHSAKPQKHRIRITLALLKGEIGYKEYLQRIGYYNAMTKSYFVELAQNREAEIAEREARLAELEHYSETILKFEQE